jgi:hypothetical protein
MTQMPHDRRDARARAQGLINLEIQRYARRIKETALNYVDTEHDRATAAGLPFDFRAVAERGIEEGMRQYGARELDSGE